MSATSSAANTGNTQPVLTGKDLVKRYGRVTTLDNADFELMPSEILGVIGDNGAGKSSMIKAVSGAVIPDDGEILLDGKARGLPIVLISHNMPHMFEVADRIYIHRLGKRLCVIDPKDYTMFDAVAFMTGAKEPPSELLH